MAIKHGQLQSNFTLHQAALLLCGETAYLSAEEFREAMKDLPEEGMSRENLFNEVLLALDSWLLSKKGDEDISEPEGLSLEELIKRHDAMWGLNREELIQWHNDLGLELPEFLKNTFSSGNWGKSMQTLPQAEERINRLRNSQRHRERCRAIASMLWDQNPNLTQADIIRHDQINKYGCENKVYTEKNIRGWISDLDPRPENERFNKPKISK